MPETRSAWQHERQRESLGTLDRHGTPRGLGAAGQRYSDDNCCIGVGVERTGRHGPAELGGRVRACVLRVHEIGCPAPERCVRGGVEAHLNGTGGSETAPDHTEPLLEAGDEQSGVEVRHRGVSILTVATITDTAICLRRWDFSETSQTVSVLTEAHGLLRGLAKGSKRADARFSGGFDPLTRGQITLIVKAGRDLATITEWHLAEVYWASRQHLVANRAGIYMVDLTHRMLKEQDPHPQVFQALDSALQACSDRSRIGIETLIFQWRLMEACGYRPELDMDAGTGDALDSSAQVVQFSPIRGGVVETSQAGDAVRVRRGTIDLLRHVAEGDFVAAAADVEGVPRANRLLAVCFRSLLGEAPESMSWAFGDFG